MSDTVVHPGETLDALFGGRLRVLQKRRGYRLSMDPILLAHFAAPLLRGRVVDLGTGSGVIALILATRGEVQQVVGIEIDPELADMAGRSVSINGLAPKARIVCGDYREVEKHFPPQAFHHAVSNPPFHPSCAGRESPVLARAISRGEKAGSLEDVVRAARYLLGTKGRLWLTYAPSRMAHLVTTLKTGGFEPKTLRLVHGRREMPARMLILESVRGGREGLTVLPPLILYRHERVYTEELEEIYRTI